jgi:hypothetical protein
MEIQLRSWNLSNMMKYQPTLLPLMKPSKAFPPAQQKDDEVSCFPFQDFDDTLFHDSENEGEMKALNEVDIPCCTIEDKGAVHEDETIMHVENTQVLKAPAQEETVSYPPPQNFDDALLYDEGNEEEINESLNVFKSSML